MKFKAKSIRTFIGAKDYQLSRQFYRELGWEEVVISPKMSLFKVNENLGFYLQDYYVKKWCDNSMVFLEVWDVESYYAFLQQKQLTERYRYVRLTPIKEFEWGRECFMHDPSGVLWHFGQFNDTSAELPQNPLGTG